MSFNRKFLGASLAVVFLGLMGTGCGGISGTHSISPATFLMPGFGHQAPARPQPATQAPLTPAAPAVATVESTL